MMEQFITPFSSSNTRSPMTFLTSQSTSSDESADACEDEETLPDGRLDALADGHRCTGHPLYHNSHVANIRKLFHNCVVRMEMFIDKVTFTGP